MTKSREQLETGLQTTFKKFKVIIIIIISLLLFVCMLHALMYTPMWKPEASAGSFLQSLSNLLF